MASWVKTYTTTWVQGTPPNIDGLGDDQAWEQAPWGGGDFTQGSPDDGAAPSAQTKFKILYDDKNLYVLCKNLDPEPDKIVSRMSRRDGFEGDWVEINIDSYYDKRTAFSFTASVSGVKGDEYVSNNGDNWDANWDPIWYLKTSIDDEGWIAEFKIPLSQLRFANKDEHVWGLQFTRRFFRNQERSLWQYIPQDAPGWVHLFGQLKGIKGIKPQKQLEIQPYIVAKTERFDKEKGNPFATGKRSAVDVGLDAKIGITSDITLDLTVNPDFGQVEADPSQVNLSAFQLYFEEQRPFFIEGNSTLNFQVMGQEPNNLFYSRRIGRRPQRSVDTDPDGDDGVDEYVETKENTRILGAAKVTGKNKKGFSWGLLESVTAREYVEVDSLGLRRKEAVEPLTNYLVGRVQQDINKGKTIVGGMFTATHRDIEEPELDFLHSEAYSAGFDIKHYWKARAYYISGKVAASHVMGSAESIKTTQYASERYFQRPNNKHTAFDTTRTTLTGTAGTVVVGKNSGKIVGELGYTWRSPELSLNDIGFLSQTDYMTQWLWLQYRKLKPFGVFRWLRLNINEWINYDFGGTSLKNALNFNGHLQFKNFWGVSAGVSYNTNSISNADLRGGPSITYPGGIYPWIWVGTDSRKKFRAEFNQWWGHGFEDYENNNGFEFNFVYRPSNNLTISAAPSMSNNKNALQYIGTAKLNDDTKYIVGTIDQRTYNMSFRVTYMVTPNLSIQYWGQPFASTGTYSAFKQIIEPNAENYNSRYKLLSPTYNVESRAYEVDEDNDGAAEYSFEDPDFNFVQLRSNMVLRWEYTPGSTLFLVWTQSRTDSPSLEHHNFNHLYEGLFDKTPQNVFLIKYTYRFLL